MNFNRKQTQMKKTLISLAILAAAGAAHAQSNVTIYGAVDIGYVKSTDTSLTMREGYNNRLGFMGSEDLGGGLKATFQLEKRFNLTTGQSSYRGEFDGAANVGLTGSFGQVRFGRVNELSTETYRVIDPFQQYGVGSMMTTVLRGDDGSGRISNTTRYDSPVFNGLKFGASYTLKPNTTNWLFSASEAADDPVPVPASDFAPNVGYALSGTYTNGPLYLVANYNVAANTNNSYNWNLGASYAFGPLKLSLGYEKTTDKLLSKLLPFGAFKGEKWLIGASYTIGNGVINASYNHRSFSSSLFFSSQNDADEKFALGYTYNLSKRTAIYADASTTKYGSGIGVIADMLRSYSGDVINPTELRTNAFSVGITHKF